MKFIITSYLSRVERDAVGDAVDPRLVVDPGELIRTGPRAAVVSVIGGLFLLLLSLLERGRSGLSFFFLVVASDDAAARARMERKKNCFFSLFAFSSFLSFPKETKHVRNTHISLVLVPEQGPGARVVVGRRRGSGCAAGKHGQCDDERGDLHHHRWCLFCFILSFFPLRLSTI